MFSYVMLSMTFIFFSGSISFLLNYSHLLNSLLSLEFISSGIFFLMVMKFSGLSEEIFSLYFLVILVCESVLGLSLLITSIYGYSLDYMKSMMSVVC
uniref:NADH-ubiquinone oxidoreductase chain 4L n=1 Tax=Pseudoniphargus carpalis TaxID=2211484 RepID=A0A345K5R0_9CRUS|nr:NADH dehydrogenase subunit 4L [Pseudoniphargus carpalis]AXH38202.1 NADH dehydrogenase subunit 4L [Pseudoniphargus carpalis]